MKRSRRELPNINYPPSTVHCQLPTVCSRLSMDRVKHFILLFGLLLSFETSFSQRRLGLVFDADTHEPLSGVVVQFVNGTVVSDAGGKFTIPDTTKMIECSHVGYTTKKIIPDGIISVPLSRDPSQLQEIIFTANRQASERAKAPVAINTISSKTLNESKPTALFEVVNKIPGVLMLNYNNEQHGMSIRQPMGQSNYYLYMEDGIPTRPMGVFNHNALLEVNQFTVSSIEVVKGPVSSMYGPEAVGGAINFLTQRPTAMPTAKVGVQFDQFGYRRLQLSTGAKYGKFGFYAGGMFSKQTDSWMARSDYDKSSINLRMEYDISQSTRLVATSTYTDYYSSTSGSVDSIAFYSRSYESSNDFTYRKSMALRNRLTIEHQWADDGNSFFTVFHRTNKHGQNPSYGIRWTPGQATARGEINSNDFVSYGFIAQHTQPVKFWNTRIIGGAMFDYTPNNYWSYQVDLDAQLRPGGNTVEKYTIARERPDIGLANYDAIIRNGAIYAQLETEPINNLRLVAGVRLDRMSFTYDNYLDNSSGSKKYEQLTPKIGATYRLTKNVGIYGNFSRGFAPPALTTVFRRKPNTDPAEFYYNLQPGQFDNYELGGWITMLRNKLFFELAIYQLNGRNELLSVRQPDNSFDYQSAGRTLHKGVEYNITYKPSSQFNFRFGGTTALHRFEDFLVSERQADAVKNLEGLEMPSAPRTTFNTEFAYYPKWFKGFRTAIEWQHVGGWYENQVNTVRYEGYHLLNFRVGYTWKGVEIYTNMLNVTNVLYANNVTRGNNPADLATFTPAAPRTFVFGIQYSFTGKAK